MAFMRERQLAANGLNFFVAEAGEPGNPLVLCLHGFPECWASWRYQLPVLAQSGYHAVAPDLRGYGYTGGPVEADSYRQSVLVEDVVALIRALGHESAILVGHDWGCALTWQVARRYPQMIRAVVGMSVPYGGPAPEAPTESMRRLFEDRFFYMLYFQKPQLPEQELEADVPTSLRKIFHGLSADGIADFRVGPDDTGFLQSMPIPEQQPRWMREEDLAYYVERFQHSGFTGPINWYRAMDASWEESRDDDNWQLTMPTLFIGGMQDPVIVFSQKALQRMPDYIPDLRTVMLDQCGHWIQMEQAAEVNREMIAFLEEVDGKG
ncbi:alpha/beta hydrolase [Alcanivorax sp.]|jgi:pimeloyl-ACP methyl ester carboxylesterase|uniref:alpha/beta fold hydrolase n=1 Tax=Alcanivorax sp. TaxID=1872427 RepID=UPI00198A8D0B|nr:alpha/beta hydrolase [Alcanivorax sp.]MBD3642883.1 alpha/beta hydrolase [Alcanivorax sp.]